MSEQPGLPPRAKWRDRELTDAEIQAVLSSSRRNGRRRKAALAALELANTTRLIAQSKLWKEAAHIVQEKLPRNCDDLEQDLWMPLSVYSETVFDKIANDRAALVFSTSSLSRYVHWLRFTCISAVVDEDVCAPGGQLFATLKHIADVIGAARRPAQIDETRRVLYRMSTEFLGGIHRDSLANRLRAHLGGCIARWEGEVTAALVAGSAALTDSLKSSHNDEIGLLSQTLVPGGRNRIESVDSSDTPRPQPGTRRRGRPQTLPDEKKAAALEAKNAGGSNRDAAAILYATKHPSPQQVKNVSTLLRIYAAKVNRPNSTRHELRKPSRKPNENRG